jgi:hypothetical protein
MRKERRFITELSPEVGLRGLGIDRDASSPIVFCNVPRLHHKVLHDAMDTTAPIAEVSGGSRTHTLSMKSC